MRKQYRQARGGLPYSPRPDNKTADIKRKREKVEDRTAPGSGDTGS
jgi:hypothetical protein